MQSSDLGVFFLSCVSFAVLVAFAGKFRKSYFARLDTKDLAIKDPFWSNLYGLAIFIVLGIMLFDLLSVLQTSCWFNDVYSNCGNSHHFESIWFSRMHNNLIWYYIFALIIPIMWTTWTLILEINISKRMREARTDLLLGNIDSVPNREPMPPVEVQVPAPRQSDEPATFEEVLQAMEAELEKAMDAAKQLKQELDETKEKVETLEVEVQEKDIEIQQIKESKTNFDKMISEKSEEKDSEIKSLSLTDSVMVGDSVMGGVKIDKQINNDPEAIARAVINAYKMGASDSQ